MDWRYNTIWFDQLEHSQYVNWDCNKSKITDLNLDGIEYAMIWYFKHKDISFDLLPDSETLLFLELSWANIKDLRGISKYKNLKRLELEYCTKLEHAHGISTLKDNLEFLFINKSKKFTFSEELLSLKNLKVLCLNSCNDIESLNFLKYFPNLIDFRFVDTKVIDGDLRPLIEHPSLRTASFLNKRHYNYKTKQINFELNNKFKAAYRDELYKGKYMTFKYKAFNNDK